MCAKDARLDQGMDMTYVIADHAAFGKTPAWHIRSKRAGAIVGNANVCGATKNNAPAHAGRAFRKADCIGKQQPPGPRLEAPSLRVGIPESSFVFKK